MRRGEIRWYTFALPDKRRPVLLLSRDAVLPSLNEVIVVPATRTIRGIDTELVLTEDDGMPTACALNFDHVSLARKANRCNDCPIGRRSLARGRARSARRLRLRAQRIALRASSHFRRGSVSTEPERLRDFCSDSRTRTLDPAVNSRLLYQLS